MRGGRATDSGHGKAVPENLLARQPAPTGPNQVWVTDITYLRTEEGWVYLAAILDLWSRRVVGWACAASLHVALVLAALHRKPCNGVGRHRVCFITPIAAASMSTKAICAPSPKPGWAKHEPGSNCYDNAAMESFWSTLKTETGIEETMPTTRRR